MTLTNDFANIIVNLFTPEGFGNLLGFFLIVLQSLYVIFAFIMVRQVSIKNSSVITNFAPVFSLLAWAHLAAAILVLLASWAVL